MPRVATNSPGGKPPKTAAAGNASASNRKRNGGAARGANNKPCSCSKKPSASNRDRANRTRRGTKARCQRCKRTGAQVGASKIAELMRGGSPKPSSLDYWRTKGSKIVADHKVPAAKIKQMPGFAKLERVNPAAARKVMTAQFNMQKLCAICNRAKSAGGNFQPERLQRMINGYLT